MKTCTKCGKLKELTEFYKRIDCSGYTSHCKDCEKERYRNYHRRKREQASPSVYTEADRLRQWSRENAEYKEVLNPLTGEKVRLFKNYWDYEND